jgi:hypothetical protein
MRFGHRKSNKKKTHRIGHKEGVHELLALHRLDNNVLNHVWVEIRHIAAASHHLHMEKKNRGMVEWEEACERVAEQGCELWVVVL